MKNSDQTASTNKFNRKEIKKNPTKNIKKLLQLNINRVMG